VEGLSSKSGRLVIKRWKACHRKVEDLSLGGKFVTSIIKIVYFIQFNQYKTMTYSVDRFIAIYVYGGSFVTSNNFYVDNYFYMNI